MKKIVLQFSFLLFFCGCGFNKIIIEKVSSKQMVYIESVFDSNIIIYFDKQDILKLHSKHLAERIFYYKEPPISDSLYLNTICTNGKDTIKIEEFYRPSINACIYEMLLKGKGQVYDKYQKKIITPIYAKKVRQKLGQLDHDFYCQKSRQAPFFYSYLLAFGE